VLFPTFLKPKKVCKNGFALLLATALRKWSIGHMITFSFEVWEVVSV